MLPGCVDSSWLGVMLIMISVGGIVAEHLDEIGPMTIAIAIAAGSVACFIWCWRRRRTNRSSLIDDYILLLSALLLSTDAGYIEHVWNLRLLGPLVIVLALIAYDFDSRMVLSVALGALATYFGVERRVGFLWNEHSGNAIRAFLCSATIFGWRFVFSVMIFSSGDRSARRKSGSRVAGSNLLLHSLRTL